jgi:1-acyl-sn-glycerol-3-phosphate acyltransferase
MLTMIAVACTVASLGWIALVNRIVYGVSIKLSRKLNRSITTRYSRRLFAIWATWMDFRFIGENDLRDGLPPQYLVMSNHQSLMDIPLFMRFLAEGRLRFVAKAELGRYIPLISLILRGNQHCLIHRTGSPSQTMRIMDVFAERIRKNNWIPVIFPEGTRSVDGSLGTFHAAGFRRLLDKAPMPVVVCALDGGWRVSTLEGMLKNMRGGVYRVKVVKIYPAPTSKAEQVHILEEGKALIQEQLDRWRCRNQRC